jgi:hypothetical protein
MFNGRKEKNVEKLFAYQRLLKKCCHFYYKYNFYIKLNKINEKLTK